MEIFCSKKQKDIIREYQQDEDLRLKYMVVPRFKHFSHKYMYIPIYRWLFTKVIPVIYHKSNNEVVK